MSNAIDGVGATKAGGEAAKVKEQAVANGLNKYEFLQLLVAQLKNQDPMSPVGSQEFMSQMAAFSTLEQVTNLAVANEEQNQMLAVNLSLSLVGHQGKLAWRQEADGLVIVSPPEMPFATAVAFNIR